MIQNPVEYLEQHSELVERFNLSDPKDPGYWSDEETTEIKRHIKNHYIQEQSRVCCYCNKEYPTNHGRAWDTEHIQPRSKSPQFMFTPENLAASCIECNNAKSAEAILDRDDRIRYPTNPALFKIIHPHFDNYDQHIRRVGDNYYIALSEKGSATIFICQLHRFAGDGNLPVQLENRIYENLVDTIFSGSEEEAEQAVQDSNDLIEAGRRRRLE